MLPIHEQQQQEPVISDIESQATPQLQLSLGSSGTPSISASADGATAAGICSPLAGPLSASIPPVTLVFLSVEGCKVWGSRRKSVLKEVHSQLSLLLMEALRHVQGGYMCRMQVRCGRVFGGGEGVVEDGLWAGWQQSSWGGLRVVSQNILYMYAAYVGVPAHQ